MGEAWGRASIGEYRSLDLRAHEILRGVPLHDVWRVELAGGAPGLTLADVRPLLAFERLMTVNPIVRGLFVLRGLLGRLLSRRASPSPSMNPHGTDMPGKPASDQDSKSSTLDALRN